jgi:putative sporulation protein YyaC
MIMHRVKLTSPSAEHVIANILINNNLITKDTAIICLGTNDCIEDLVGPLTGTLIEENKKDLNIRVYGTLDFPLNSLNIKSKLPHIEKKEKHLLTVDSILSPKEDVGMILLKDRGMNPGAAIGNTLPSIGNSSIMCSVSEKLQYLLLNKKVSFNDVYKFSKIVCNSIIKAKNLL